MTISYKNKTRQWLPYHLVRRAADENWLNSLAYLVMIKSIYQNQTIYSYKPRKVADLLNISYNTIKFHVDILIEKGLIVMHKGNLTCIGVNKMKKSHLNKRGKESKLLVGVFIGNGRTDIVENLRATLIINNIKRQQFVLKKKSEILLSENPVASTLRTKVDYRRWKSDYNKLVKAGGAESFGKTVNNDVMLSNFKFGSLINRSKSTGRKLQKKMREKRFIFTKTRFIKIAESKSKMTTSFFKSLQLPNNHLFSIKYNSIYIQTANLIYLNPPTNK